MRKPIIIKDFEQGSLQWQQARCARITMSNADVLLISGRKGEISKTKLGYFNQVASEILTGKMAEGYYSKAMERGHALEPFARASYEKITGQKVEEVAIVYFDENERISCSPDGLVGIDGGIEIKCPQPKEYTRLLSLGIDAYKEHYAQIQGCLWVTGRAWWDFVAYCPECETYPIICQRVFRDDAVIAEIERSALEGLQIIDGILANLLIRAKNQYFGRIENIRQQALEYLASMSDEFYSE